MFICIIRSFLSAQTYLYRTYAVELEINSIKPLTG